MENNNEIIDQLLEKKCYIIDFLPERVPENSNGQFFDVEDYLLNNKRNHIIKNRFINIILKLMCYYHIKLFIMNEWIDKPTPKQVKNSISELMNDHYGTLNFLFPDENVLLVLEGDCLNLSVYNVREEMHHLFKQIAFSESMFWRSAE